jgi:beta-mannosidase
VRVFVHNDTRNATSGTISLYLRDRDFNTLAKETVKVALPPLAASEVLVKDYRSIINTTALERACFVTAELHEDSTKETPASLLMPVSRETALFVPPKYFSFRRPEYKPEVSDQGSCFAISLRSDTFCHFVRLKIEGEDPVFSDNYFDITDKKAVEILVPKDELKKSYTAQTLQAALASTSSVKPIFSVGDSY